MSSISVVTAQFLGSVIFVQFFSKVLHFALNIVIVGYFNPDTYGVAALQLPFVGMAVTRIIKETLHRTAVREKDPESTYHICLPY